MRAIPIVGETQGLIGEGGANMNAHLMVAAPELLAACEAFVALFNDSDMRPEDECHGLYAVMTAAINKANTGAS